MGSHELLVICGIAFLFVFVVLIALALCMRLIILIFPERRFGVDAAVVAALTTAIHRIFPGTNFTTIEEKK